MTAITYGDGYSRDDLSGPFSGLFSSREAHEVASGVAQPLFCGGELVGLRGIRRPSSAAPSGGGLWTRAWARFVASRGAL